MRLGVVEGDYGLDRPIGMVPTVIYRPFAVVVRGPDGGPTRRRVYGPAYLPSTGERPGYGGASKWFRRQTGRCRPQRRASSRAGRANRRPARTTTYPPFAAPPIIWNGGGRYRRPPPR